MQSTEKWLPVVGHEGIYEVSDLGRVRSLDRVSARGHRVSGRMLKLVSQAKDGPDARQTVSLHKGGKQRTRLVHHIVLEAFVGPRPEGMEACHWDGDASNNRLANLRWDTHRSNEADKLRHGTWVNADKVECPRGHPLVMPNLATAEHARGHRKCRACANAYSHAHYRGIAFDGALADVMFSDIMAGRVGMPNEACPRGHLLEVPNLVPSDLKLGRRACLACNRARSTANGKKYGIDAAVADAKYAVIMGGAL